MSVVGILDSIQGQIQIERNKILEAASKEVQQILEKGQLEADRILGVVKQKAQEGAKRERMISPQVIKAKRAGIDQVFAQALNEIEQLRNKPGYSELLKTLLLEATSGLSGVLEIQVNPQDVKLGEEVAQQLKINGKVTGVPGIRVGASISQDGGKVVNHNSFESRLIKVCNLRSGEVASILYA